MVCFEEIIYLLHMIIIIIMIIIITVTIYIAQQARKNPKTKALNKTVRC